MQSFDTKPENVPTPAEKGPLLTVGRVEEITPGRSARILLSNGVEIAVFNVDGEFYATNNFCPHKGAPLSEGNLCGYTIECDWHGWEFDVRNGECLTVPEQLQTYEVRVEDGFIKILL